MTPRPTIDASVLPAEARDARAPAWWGNALFMAIETTTVLLLLASYFYLWRNYPQEQWPPPRVDRDPPLARPVPDLLVGTLTVLFLVGTVPLMKWVDRMCRRQFDDLEELRVANPDETPVERRPPDRRTAVLAGLAAMFVLGVASCVLRVYEFPALHFAWNDNAYASLVWTALGLHLVYIGIEVLEIGVMFGWTAGFGFGQTQATDVILTAAYWYWTVAVGVVIYAVVYWFPRMV